MPGPQIRDRDGANGESNQTNGESDGVVMTEAAAVPSVQTAPNQVYAAVRSDSVGGQGSANTPVWKKIIRIDFTDKGPVSTVVQDYKLQGDLSKLIEDAMLEHADELADDDDSPEEQRLLMSAWQALAMYLASCDDEDKSGAATALKVVSDLMAGTGGGAGPFPTGTFGKTVQTAAATPPGPNKTVFECAIDNRSFSTMNGLISHLQTAHQMTSVKARATAMKAAKK